MLNHVLSESMIRNGTSFEYHNEYFINDKQNIHYSDRLFSSNFQKVYNDDGDLLHEFRLDTRMTGKYKKKRGYVTNEKLQDNITSVMTICSGSKIYLNQILAVTQSNFLYHFNSETGKIIYEDDKPLILYLGNSDKDYSIQNCGTIHVNSDYESLYLVSNLKNKSAIQVIIFETNPRSFTLKLKAKFLLDKSIFGKKLLSVTLQQSVMFLGYEDYVKIFNLDELIQNFTIIPEVDMADYYGNASKTSSLPFTLNIDPIAYPYALASISTAASIPKQFLPFNNNMSWWQRMGKNQKSDGKSELFTRGFCKGILRTVGSYFSNAIPMTITTLGSTNQTCTFQLWKLDKTSGLSLLPVSDPNNLLSYKEKQDPGVALVQPDILTDRHDRIIIVHPSYIRNILFNEKTNTVQLNYEFNALEQSTKIKEQKAKTEKKPNKPRPERSAKKVLSYFPIDIVSFDYDTETDIMAVLLASGNLFVINNLNGEICHQYSIFDSSEDMLQIMGAPTVFEIVMNIAYDKILLMFQSSQNDKVICRCLMLHQKSYVKDKNKILKN